MSWYAKASSDVYSALRTSDRGLTEADASARLAEHGPNALPEAKPESLASIFARQFKSPLIYVLFAASAIVFLLGEPIDALVILAVLIFNAIIGAIQEGRAQDTLRALRSFSATSATVVRDGREIIIPDVEVVPGDIVIVQEGEKIPADARLIMCHSIQTNESALTGESTPVEKKTEPLLTPHLPVAEQTNMLFKGTNIVAGNGRAVVVATGIDTYIGTIAKEVAGTQTEIPLQANIRALSNVIIAAVGVLCALLFILGWYLGYSAREMFATVVTLAVSVIPEGLPIVITVVLATGVWRMSKRHALVKRLQAVEALGQARVIAVDKTGTLTKNEMIIQKIYTNGIEFDVHGSGYSPEGDVLLEGEAIEPANHPELLAVGKIAALAANARVVFSEETQGWKVAGDPTEAALLVLAQKLGFRKEELTAEIPLVAEIPFDSSRKYHALVHTEKKALRLSVVGAPEILLSHSTKILRGGKAHPITDVDREQLDAYFMSFSEHGLRVVALAESREVQKDLAPEHIRDLTIVAFVGMKDGLREEVPSALRRAQDAGMRVVMITGDHKITARAIALEAGIFKQGDRVLTGEDIESLGERELARELSRTAVFARVTPEHKLRIIQAYRARGEIIAMTGDGVNDAPSLVAADLGVAMGRVGTEVAKEAADIVLLDDNFGSLVAAVEEGRSMYKTIKKTILYLFSTSIGTVTTIVGAICVGHPIPLLPSQIIWLNFVTDGFLTIALPMDPKEKNLLSEKFEKPKRYLIDPPMAMRMLVMGVPMAIGTLALFTLYLDDGLTKALTVSLTVLAAFQWFNVWNCRSATDSVFWSNPFSNIYLVGATALVVVLQLFAVYSSIGQALLRTTDLALIDWMIIIPVASSIIVVEEIRKYLARSMLAWERSKADAIVSRSA